MGSMPAMVSKLWEAWKEKPMAPGIDPLLYIT